MVKWEKKLMIFITTNIGTLPSFDEKNEIST